ncbi:MAG TPA: aminotransferase class V-fold PLP-dependent enzyme [Gemmatimonadaceae bacterium]|jgi:selenocysteine lyase/cysteine desulfurase
MISRPAYDIDAWRRRIPLLASCIPMNNCSQAPQTDATRAAAERYLDSWNRSGMDWDAWMAEVALAKNAFAKLIGAAPSDVAVFGSVSAAASAVASALDFDGDRQRIVVSGMEFPGVAHVWLAQGRRGAQLCRVPVHDNDPDDYNSLIDQRTALVSACHGWYVNGFVQDVARIAARARAAGALSFVDAYQTLGAVPVNVRDLGVDFLATGTLKFLMGVSGIAFLYVRPEIVESLHPTATGWFGRVDPFAFDAQTLDWSPNASRFDAGTPAVVNAYIARAGMEIIDEVNPASIRAWHEVLAGRMIDGGRARGLVLHGTDDVSRKTATTAFVVPDSHAVEAAMRARGVLPSARGQVIRLAPHFYTTLDDVDCALDTLADVIRAR